MSPNEERYMVISCDSHVGLPLKTQLRKFCPPQYLSQYDDFVSQAEASVKHINEHRTPASTEFRYMRERSVSDPGVTDPRARLALMDDQGIVAEVLFAGSGSGEPIPFVGTHLNAGNRQIGDDLIIAGCQIWNDGMAEFCSQDSDRLIGAMQIPIWDVGATVAELRRSRPNGLHVVNLPAPRNDYPPYSSSEYEPLWEVCEELAITLVTHGGGGERPLGESEDCGYAFVGMETHWLSRRGIWQLIFGGVFERHPTLRIVFTEQRANWITETVRDLDSVYTREMEYHMGNRFTWTQPALSKMPSDYWAENCYVGVSFMAPFEAKRYDEFGMQNIMWGSDYPHLEGTWPVTELAMRNTFAGLPEDWVRRMLGETALPVYRLVPERMSAIANKIGPLPSVIARPLATDEAIPANRSHAFRDFGMYAGIPAISA